jgi:glycosyltransferase involved in cell wall biosynthesis
VADRATFTGQVSQADMPALMRSADLLLNLSPDEALATITVDAMACGLPVIAAAAGAHRDAVIDRTTGLLVSPGPPIQLARRIGRLLASPMREGMAIAAASRARDRYSWERIAQQTLDVCEKSVQEHG